MEKGERRSRAQRRVVFGLMTGGLVMMLVPFEAAERIKLGILNILRPVHWCAKILKDQMTIREPDPLLVSENEYLAQQLAELKQEVRGMRAAAQTQPQDGGQPRPPEGRPDSGWRETFTFLPADVVIPVDGSPFRGTMVLARGSVDGVAKGALVVSHQYVVGRISEVSALTCRAVLTHDPAFKIGALCLRVGDVEGNDSEVGIAQGTGSGRMTIRWISEPRGLGPGDYALTTLDPVRGVPKGLILGRITMVDQTGGPYADIAVAPGLDGNLLERVHILLPRN